MAFYRLVMTVMAVGKYPPGTSRDHPRLPSSLRQPVMAVQPGLNTEEYPPQEFVLGIYTNASSFGQGTDWWVPIAVVAVKAVFGRLHLTGVSSSSKEQVKAAAAAWPGGGGSPRGRADGAGAGCRAGGEIKIQQHTKPSIGTRGIRKLHTGMGIPISEGSHYCCSHVRIAGTFRDSDSHVGSSVERVAHGLSVSIVHDKDASIEEATIYGPFQYLARFDHLNRYKKKAEKFHCFA
uniref:Uncharacterized protein n=1 Tax=Oryza sativa subsp. indica TaxID=39946 RepID=C5NNQ2_ORYSI|nr:hypothetical protein [Oryza sativa Indica Group]